MLGASSRKQISIHLHPADVASSVVYMRVANGGKQKYEIVARIEDSVRYRGNSVLRSFLLEARNNTECILKIHYRKEKERNNDYPYLRHNRVIRRGCCFSPHYRACSMCTLSKCDAA